MALRKTKKTASKRSKAQPTPVDSSSGDYVDPSLDPNLYSPTPLRYRKKKTMLPMALAAVVLCGAVGVGSYFCVSSALANMQSDEAQQQAAIQQQIQAQKDAQEAQQQALEEAIAKREKEADEANKKFGDKVIELRPEQTREEIAETQAKETVPVGVDGEAVSPETDGRAMWITLEEGDTLGAIAEYFNIDLPTLLELNDIDDSTELYAGDMIRVG